MSLIKRSWPHFGEPQVCRNHIYVIAVVKFSNRSIQNLFHFYKWSRMDSHKLFIIKFTVCESCKEYVIVQSCHLEQIIEWIIQILAGKFKKWVSVPHKWALKMHLIYDYVKKLDLPTRKRYKEKLKVIDGSILRWRRLRLW